MKRVFAERGYLLIDVIVGLSLFGFILLATFAIYAPTFRLSRDIDSRLEVQQEVRLTLDRVARTLHETTTAYGRFRAYLPQSGCSGQYQGCVGFATARDNHCVKTFQLTNGRPNWQATLYLWRDVASNELRLRCEPETTVPVVAWPPIALEPYTVVGRHITDMSVTLQSTGNHRPVAVAIAIQGQSQTSPHRAPATFLNKTILLPHNQ